MTTKTLLRPFGGETYDEFEDRWGNKIVLTYNDLWMILVCNTALDGDWLRTRQAAAMVTDPSNKRALAERLWELEQTLGGLPEVPLNIQTIHIHRAHVWFKQRPVIFDKKW